MLLLAATGLGREEGEGLELVAVRPVISAEGLTHLGPGSKLTTAAVEGIIWLTTADWAGKGLTALCGTKGLTAEYCAMGPAATCGGNGLPAAKCGGKGLTAAAWVGKGLAAALADSGVGRGLTARDIEPLLVGSGVKQTLKCRDKL